MTQPSHLGETGSFGASEDDPVGGPGGSSAGGRRLVDWRISPLQTRLLALSSALATGLVIWAGLGREGSTSSLAAAVAQRSKLLASAAAGAKAAGSSAESSTGSGEVAAESGSSSASGGETAEAGESGEAESGESGEAESGEAGETGSSAAAGQEAPETASSAPASAPTTKTSTGSAKPESKIKHVFIITLASPGYEQTWGAGSPARYLNAQLRPRGTLLSNYYAIGHLDLPNYLAMISGQPPNALTAADCQTFAEFQTNKLDAAGRLEAPGCVYPVGVLTVGDQLTSTGHQWRAYVEDLANGPKPVQSCRHPNSNQPDETQHARAGDAYATRHNPFVYFHSLLDLGDCASNDLPLTKLTADLASPAKTPSYAFIVPNLCHDGTEPACPDGSPGGLQAADAFLAEWVPKILASPAYRRNGLLVITFGDGPPSDDSGCCDSAGAGSGKAVGGGRVGALLLSPYVKPGGESKTPYNHYSLLRTVEDIFGLDHLANAGQAGVNSFSSHVLKGVFSKHR
jgi:hypothetical protein